MTPTKVVPGGVVVPRADELAQLLGATRDEIDEMAKRTGASRFPSPEQLRGWRRVIDSAIAMLAAAPAPEVLDECPACKHGQAACGYHTRNPQPDGLGGVAAKRRLSLQARMRIELRKRAADSRLHRRPNARLRPRRPPPGCGG